MKVWPPAGHHRSATGGSVKRRPHPSTDLATWALHEEKLLVETRFAGDSELYGAWRDRLWAEMHDTMHRTDGVRAHSADEEHVVRTAFGGDWTQYRICRDRLREELWQIMKITRGHC
jgi:hypothetical protein